MKKKILQSNKDKIITIRDIARMANVSIGTVSRVINNKGYVKEETRRNIEKIIASTGYTPNVNARSMVSKKSSLVGMIVPEINNPFHSEFVVAVERILARENLSILLCNSEYRFEKEAKFINELIQRNAEGLIFVSSDLEDKELAKKVGLHLKAVGVSSKLVNFDCINLTNWQGAFDITEHLISIGHKRIACIGVAEVLKAPKERLEGYMAALNKHNIQVRDEYILGVGGVNNVGYDRTIQLLEMREPPTAIFCITDYYAINAYKAILDKGLRVGEDISVAGFDDIPISKLLNPSLTTVKFDVKTMAELATDLLLKKINSNSTSDAGGRGREILLKTEIVVRDSTKPIN